MAKKSKKLRSICLAVQNDNYDATFSCIYDNSKPFFIRVLLIFQFILKRFFQKTKFGIDYICYDVQNREILSSKKFFTRSLPPEFFYERNSLCYIMEYINGIEISEYFLTERSKPVVYEFIIVHSVKQPINENKFTFSDLFYSIKYALLNHKFVFPLFFSMIIIIFSLALVGLTSNKNIKSVTDKSFSFKISSLTVNCTYEGEWLNDAPNGHGELIVSEDVEGYWKKGDRIIGKFENGFLNGDGIYISIDGNNYNGEFINNMLNGFGTLVFANREKLEAEFKNNIANGQGKYTFLNGDIYDGTYVNGQPNGYGIYKFSDGGVYEGFFKNGRENGYGKYTFVDGSNYEGEYKDGKWEGVGILKDSGGKIIEQGTWSDNKIVLSAMTKVEPSPTPVPSTQIIEEVPEESAPPMSETPATSFEQIENEEVQIDPTPTDTFVIDEYPNQHSIIVNPHAENNIDINGYVDNIQLNYTVGDLSVLSTYSGRMKNSQPDGQGKLVIQENTDSILLSKNSGDYYWGSFDDGVLDGFGQFKGIDGSSYIGTFENGLPDGEGTYIESDGSIYIGAFKNGMKHGRGIFTSSDGLQYSGNFKNDQYDGKGVMMDFRGVTLKSGKWKNGEFIEN